MVKLRMHLMKIGVLDIQGSVAEHVSALKKCGAEVVLVKTVGDLRECSGLIIPGGESTTIGKLLKRFGLFEEIIRRAEKGMAVWGTCAGAILLAKKIIGQKRGHVVDNLNLMDITVSRNAYGRQLDSFETEIEFDFGKKDSRVRGNDRGGENDNVKKIPAVFIRAPKIFSVGSAAKVLARCEEEIVAVREGNLLATTFHPEMTDDLKVHEYFIGMGGE